MDEHEVGAVQRFIEIERAIVLSDIDPRKQPDHFTKHLLAAVADRVEAAPAIDRLVDDDFVTELLQLARDPAKEMRIAVVPAGGERMIEQDALHARTPANSWLALLRRES